jgi:hypothetical protein
VAANITEKQARFFLSLAAPRPPTIRGYEQFEELGSGGIGAVTRARRMRDGKIVAFKTLLAHDPMIRRWFLRGGRLAKELPQHRHVVHVEDCDEADGHPFIAMELIEDAKHLCHLKLRSPEDARTLLMKVASGVAHAHREGVLHRDLKPSNVLVGPDGEPRVSDFDLAMPVGHRPSDLSFGVVVGTLPYLAPEQLTGQATFETDVYALGAIFYELLTGHAPFSAAGRDALAAKIRNVYPIPPRKIAPSIDHRLETICLTCLEKSPSNRYSSPEELAEALDGAGRLGDPGRSPIRPRRAAPIRAWRWARRRWLIAMGLGVAALLAIIAAGIGAYSWQAHVRHEADMLERNAFIASIQAVAMLFQLRDYADRTGRASGHPFVADVLKDEKVVNPAAELAPLAVGLDHTNVQTNQCRILAIWPKSYSFIFERSYLFRDYCQGALRLAKKCKPNADDPPPVYLSRAYRSESRGWLTFAFSTPVLNRDCSKLAGIFVNTLNAKEVFGAVRMQGKVGGDNETIVTALLGPRGNDREDGPEPATSSRYSYLVHPRLALGAEHRVPEPVARRFREEFGDPAAEGAQFSLEYGPLVKNSDYEDPIPGSGGRWLAAFAPVGKTGSVVLVQSPKKSWRSSAGARVSWAMGAVALGLALAMILGAAFLREKHAD